MLIGSRLYRELLKEARALPDQLASSYYRERIRNSCRATSNVESSLQVTRRTRRAQQMLRHLQAANDGYLHSLSRVLETAHGLRGPEKHASLSPFLSQDQARHTFSPPLAALLGSTISHTSRPPTPAQLRNPPTLPERADPASEEARLLGPLKPERIRAIRRRWWNAQTNKLRAPLAVRVYEDGKLVDGTDKATESLLKANTGLEEADLGNGVKRLALLETKATVPLSSRPLPPKRLQTSEQRSTYRPAPSKTARPVLSDQHRRTFSPTSRNTKWHAPKQITGRLMRRRAAGMLENAPIVDANVKDGGKSVGYEVVRSKVAKGERGRFARVSDEDLWWLQRGELKEAAKGTRKPK
ncbi:hypothetical protein JCM5353_003264 [Sporobolomyces roseus]